MSVFCFSTIKPPFVSDEQLLICLHDNLPMDDYVHNKSNHGDQNYDDDVVVVGGGGDEDENDDVNGDYNDDDDSDDVDVDDDDDVENVEGVEKKIYRSSNPM